MDVPHQLQTLLQFLASDASSVVHLTYILDHLSSSCLAPSPHLQKWVTRVTSLMHSKDPAARWAAICIAYRMSFLSRSLLVENAQSWIGDILPSLSKPESVPILRVSMRYLSLVICSAGHNPEFQRQVAIPVVPKVSSALLTIAERHNDQDIKTSSIRTLTQLAPSYPSLHKSLSQRLFALCHQIFSGLVRHTSDDLFDATVNLYAVVHFLGGRVGGTNLWRNCLDEALQISWSAWLALRTTFPTSARLSHKAILYLHSSDGRLPNPLSHVDTTGDPLLTASLNLNRLKCGIDAIAALLRVPANRPVRVPIGHLATFCWCLLASTREEEGQTHVDPHVRVSESVVVPQIWMHACRLLSSLAQAVQALLAPHTSRLITAISSHLENNLEPPQRHSFLRCAYHLLYFCPVGATLATNRLLKATIVFLHPLYLRQPREESSSVTIGQPRSSKKRRREYEADNVLSVTNITVCATADECEMFITALDVVDQCLLNAELVSSTRSLVNRTLLSILMSLPSMPPSSLSADPKFHARVTKRVRDMCVESVQGTSHAMSDGASLVLRSFSENLAAHDKIHSFVDLLLHPRRPPYVRTLHFVESLSLSSADESAEEAVTRQPIGYGKISSITSEPQTHQTQSEPTIQNQVALDQQAVQNPPQERASPTSVGLRPLTTTDIHVNLSTMEAPTPSAVPVLPPSQAVIDVLAGPPSPIPPKEPTPSIYVVPMLVDGSDSEEVPTIDLGSDSEA